MGRVQAVQGKFRYYLDILKLHVRYRWMATFILACFYAIRAYLHGYGFLTYFLGMLLSTLVNLLMYTAIDPDELNQPVSSDAPLILQPIKASAELRPFVPFLPEFNFWCAVNVVLCVALVMITFIHILNIPGCWNTKGNNLLPLQRTGMESAFKHFKFYWDYFGICKYFE